MESTYIPTAPTGYAYHKHLFSDLEVREKYPFILLLILANFIALIPLALGIILLWLPYQYYLYLSTPYAFFAALEIPLIGKIIVGAAIFFASMLFHEWLHGVALQIMGHKAHYAFHKLFLTATIEDGDYLNRRQYLLMTLTPLIVMSVCGGVMLLFFATGHWQIAFDFVVDQYGRFYW